MNRALTGTGMFLALALTVSCGPARYPAPQARDIGPGPDGGGNRTGEVDSTARSTATTGRVVPRAEAPPPPPRAAGEPRVVPLTEPPPGDFSFLGEFVQRVARQVDAGRPGLVVLPAFHVNPLFQRYEVSQLGESLAQDLVRRLREKLGPDLPVISPEMFELALQEANRSLADLDSPGAAVELVRRIGASYLVRGLIRDTSSDLIIEYELVDSNAMRLAETRESFALESSAAQRHLRLFRDRNRQPILSSYRIGPLAAAGRLSLRAELQWIVSRAVSGLLAEAGPALRDLPVAVLPTKLPDSFKFDRYQQAMRRAILAEKKRLVGLGFDESRALSEGPVRILGETYQNLRQAEDRASELELERKVSSGGELAATISRIVFDELEEQGEAAGVRVIPSDDLVIDAQAFSREELAKIDEGILDESTRESFQTRGARALVFSELLEAGDGYEFVFQLRRLDNLERLTGKHSSFLEPRFAYELRGYLKN